MRRLERNYFDWRAVHLHLSQLKAQNRRDYQLRVAASEFDGLLRRFNSELFLLRNGDIVYPVARRQPERRRSGGPAPALPVQR